MLVSFSSLPVGLSLCPLAHVTRSPSSRGLPSPAPEPATALSQIDTSVGSQTPIPPRSYCVPKHTLPWSGRAFHCPRDVQASSPSPLHRMPFPVPTRILSNPLGSAYISPLRVTSAHPGLPASLNSYCTCSMGHTECTPWCQPQVRYSSTGITNWLA